MKQEQTISKIQAALQDRRIAVVSESTGLGRNTIYRLRNGSDRKPTAGTIKILADYLGVEAQ